MTTDERIRACAHFLAAKTGQPTETVLASLLRPGAQVAAYYGQDVADSFTLAACRGKCLSLFIRKIADTRENTKEVLS